MADYKDPGEDAAVKVTMRPASESGEEKPGEEKWANDFVEDGGDATKIDPDALRKLREEESGAHLRPSAPEASTAPTLPTSGTFERLSEDAVGEFDDQSMTVMDPRSLAEREPSSDALTPGSEPCPKCGVLVSPGYPKCPRCKAVLVSTPLARDKAAGGTTVIGRTIPWTIVVIAAVLTAIIYYLAEREPKVKVLKDDDLGDTQPPDEAESVLPATNDEPADELIETQDAGAGDQEEDLGDEL